MIMPGVQKPHCSAWFSRNAACIGCSSPSLARPSIVVTSAPSACDREHGAGLDRAAIDVDHAGAALAGVAADMGAGEAEMLAQELDQQRARLDLARHRLAVDLH